ncbi:MAG: hypothetical protein EBU92_14345 [Betaproteobacteria bacterium]|nr:hypothetical protein [Betaproteobacteria bacterium]
MDPLNGCATPCPAFASATYVAENVNQCRVKRKGAVYQCELDCECKSPYFSDNDIFCNRRPAKKKKKMHKGAIAGIVGGLLGAFMLLGTGCSIYYS